MSKLYIKSQTENTIAEEREQMIADGRPVMAQEYQSKSVGIPRFESVGVSHAGITANGLQGTAMSSKGISDPVLHGNMKNTGQYSSGFDVPMPGLGGKSVRMAVHDGDLDKLRDIVMGRGIDPSMDGSSLIEAWQSLWDAQRIDLTIRKTSKATIREMIYNVADNPNADQTTNINEFFPHFFEFIENNGTGQAVDLGELRGGQVDTMQQVIYAAGLTWDLTKELFDRTLNMERINDGIATAEAGKKDDLAIKPITTANYTGKTTVANTTSGATREELLHKTIQDGMDGIGLRRDPITQRRLSTNNAIILTDPLWAPRIQQVLGGTANMPAAPGIGRYPAIPGIRRVIGYEGERLTGNTKSVTYTDIPANTAYIIIPNRRMLIGVKRNLQLEVNMNPNPLTLAREERAWWFCEGIYNDGITYFIQKVNMSSWA
jgi:hypothetical protein